MLRIFNIIYIIEKSDELIERSKTSVQKEKTIELSY